MEIKILCPCGAKFKFDVEPVNGVSPGPVHCPVCGQDRTEATNALIKANLAPAAAQPAPTPAISVSAPTTAGEGPRISIPAVRVASPAVPAPVVRVSAPVAATPPAPVAPAPATPSPAPSSGGGAISPKMAFMPVPTSGGASLSVSGQHGKKEEPKAEAASGPATPPPVPTHAHPATMKAAQAMPTRVRSGEGNFALGIVGASVGAVVVAVVWYLIAANSVPFSFFACFPGIAAGFLAVLLAKQPSHKLGIAAAVIATIIAILTQIALVGAINDRKLNALVASAYKERLDLSKRAANAKTDDEIRGIMVEDSDSVGEAVTSLVNMVKAKEADKSAPDSTLENYKAKKLPALIKFSKGEPSRMKFEETSRAKFAADDDNLYRMTGFRIGFIVFWIVSGAQSAYKIGSRKKG